MHYTTVRLPGFAPRTAQFLDIPIGDPYGGPAYGEKLKGGGGGLMGVVAAVAAVYTGGASLGMWGAGAATTTLGTIAGGAMFAGGILSGVGAVTGNKKLAKVGGILTLAGGIGGMVNSLGTNGASLLSEGKDAFSWDNVSKNIGDSFNKVFESAPAGVDKASSATISLDNPNSQMNMLKAEDAAFGGLQNETASALGQKGTLQLQDAGMGVGQNGMTAETAAAAKTGTNAVGTVAGGSQSTGILGKVTDFAKSQGGGQLISGGMKMIGDGLAASSQEDLYQQRFDQMARESDFTMAQRELQTQNANAKFAFLDPSDPQYAAKKQQAQAAGQITINMGINQNAGPVTSNGVTQQANQVKVGV